MLIESSLNARAVTRAVPRQAPTPRNSRHGVRRWGAGRGTGRGRTRAGAASRGPPTPRHTCCSCPSSRCRSPSSGRARCRRTRPRAARAGTARQGGASPRVGLPLPAGWVHRHQLAAQQQHFRHRDPALRVAKCLPASKLMAQACNRPRALRQCLQQSGRIADAGMGVTPGAGCAPRQLSVASRPRQRWHGC